MNTINILILSGKFGMGHRSAALALEERLKQRMPGACVTEADLMEQALGAASAGVYQTFAALARRGGPAFNRLYRAMDRQGKAAPVPARQLFLKTIHRLAETANPQAVISTLPLCTQLAAEYKRRTGSSFLLVSCVTDISCHSEWIAPEADLYCAASAQTKQALIQAGVSPEKILVTGVPVRPSFRVPAEGERQARRILVTGGGLGLMPEDEDFYLRLAAIPGAQIAAVTGRNQNLRRRLQNLAPNIQALGFVEDMAEQMRRSDLMISKPGGSTLFEAVASDLPLLAVRPSLEQEKRNAAFLAEEQIGLTLPSDATPMAWAAEDLLLQPAVLEKMRDNMDRLRRQASLERLFCRLESLGMAWAS